MTTIDYDELPAAVPVSRRRPFAALRSWYAAVQRRRRERLAIVELSRLDAHLLRDIGINPSDVCDAFNGRRTSILFDPVRR